MKNAIVLVHHYGDDGNAPEGRILKNVTSHRFEQLEKQGLVREATAEEVERGGDVAFDKDSNEQIDLTPPAAEGGGEKQAEEHKNKAAPSPKTKAAS